MHLVYLDESGNSGMNLNDPAQPIFVLCAMIVDEQRWQALEKRLMEILDNRLPQWKSMDGFEIHAVNLRKGAGPFSGMRVADRIAFRDEWMKAGADHGVRLICREVHKKRFAAWLVKTFGPGVLINPHVAAFALLARCVDNYLKHLPGPPLGMLISDENKEVVKDIEKSIRLLRGTSGAMRLSQIVEKGFFVDSSKSLLLQLCDLFALSVRKGIEREQGAASKTIDDSGIELSKALLFSDHQHDRDVLEWLTVQHAHKKEAARG
jgi:hypothetical protein